LDFHPCFDTYQCARLSVPLDWSSERHVSQDGDRPLATIAIIKRPALVNITDPRYAGPIIFNPGGPGNSGVKFLLQYGASFETFLDPQVPIFTKVSPDLSGNTEKYFDLISFDPRGVNNTIPRPNCISDPLTRQIWNHDLGSIGTGVDDETTFGLLWARIKAYGAICNRPSEASFKELGDAGIAAQYVSSAQVASDMVAIIERHGIWRESETRRLIHTSLSKLSMQEENEILARNTHRVGEEKLQYWGFSYGSVLGQTFASMFPDKVGRMVLDGNVDADDYASTSWTKSLQDIDAITSSFGVACFKAGVDKCNMYDEDGPKTIANTVIEILERLRQEPRWSIAADGSPVIITQSDITSIVFDNLYNTYYGFPIIDKLLFSLLNENYEAFAQQNLNGTCATSTSTSNISYFDPQTPSLAIRCTDGVANSNMTKEEAQAHIKLLRGQSDLFGENWALFSLQCTGYTARAKFRFEGPFGATSRDLNHPILFANPELDPVTPLRNAVEAAKDYPGSKVLEIKGAMGHCTLSMPSLEGLVILRRYFSTGELPAEQLTRVDTSVTAWDVELKRPDNVGEKIWVVVGQFSGGFPRSLRS